MPKVGEVYHDVKNYFEWANVYCLIISQDGLIYETISFSKIHSYRTYIRAHFFNNLKLVDFIDL